jgi:drug/metabolite transporter (DMT)-like permease
MRRGDDKVVSPIEDRQGLGIGLTLFAFLCFAIIDSCAKLLLMEGFPTLQVIFVRYLGQFVLVLAVFAPTEGLMLVRTRQLGTEVLRALCLIGQTLFNFLAIIFIPLTITAPINSTTPLIVCALSGPLLGERIGWHRWFAITLGFFGVS